MLYILIPALIVIILVAFYASRHAFQKAESISQAHSDAKALVNEWERRILVMQSDIANKEHSQGLNSLYESIRYSDKSGESEVDSQIESTLLRLEMALKDNAVEDATVVIDELTALLKRRSIDIRASKRGGF
ncbi:MAG: hypothetical protein FWE11_08055 [Defluviitaleaceae bacterium]|nr:hypothetical protein [Defluviitaleaceae bacterium]